MIELLSCYDHQMLYLHHEVLRDEVYKIDDEW